MPVTCGECSPRPFKALVLFDPNQFSSGTLFREGLRFDVSTLQVANWIRLPLLNLHANEAGRLSGSILTSSTTS